MAPGPIKVLLIDDEPDLCEVVKAYLSRSGEFEIATANSVAEAREAMCCRPFDVVVSDYQMPQEDGIQLLKSLRSAGNAIPFILFTGKGREEVVIEAINSGADFYLQKGGKLAPMYSELAHKIRAAARRHQAETSLRQSDSMYRALFDRSVDPIALIDENGYIMSANAAAGSLMGIRVEELVGKHPRDFRGFREKSISDFLAAVATSREEGSAQRVFRLEIVPGEPRWIELHLSSMDIGNGHLVTQIIVRDITVHRMERKTREDVLRLHRELAANIPGIVYRLWLVPEKRVVLFNDFVEELTGYAADELRMGELGCVEGIAIPEDKPRISAAIRESIERCEPFVIEYRIERKDGRIRYVYDSGRPKIGPNGGALYIDGVVFDDSSRRIAMMRENVTHDYFQSLFRNTSDMVVYHDIVRDADGKAIDYRIIGFNDAFCRITGFTRKDAEGALASAIYGQAPPPYIEEFDQVARTGVQVSFYTFYAPISHHFRISVVRVGEDGFATITSDITRDVESKKALEMARDELEEANQRLAAAEEELRQQVDSLEDGGAALRESEERYRMLVESSNDGVIVHKDGIVIFANQTMADILDYPSPKMLIGTNSLDFLVPSQRHDVASRVAKASSTTMPALREKLVRRDGSMVTALVSARPLPAMGKGSAMVIIHDITEEEAAHEEVKKLNADLTVQNEINKIMLLESGRELDTRLLEVVLRELDSRVGFIGHVESENYLEVDAMNLGGGCRAPDPRMRFPRSAWGSIWGRSMEECRTKKADFKDLKLPASHISMETVLCVPLTHLGRALGVISVADRNGGYGPEEEMRLETIAAYISPLIAVRIEKELAENERLRAEKALEEVNRKLQLMTGVTRHDIINQLTILRGNLALSSAESQGAASRHHAEKAMVAADNIESMIRFTKEYQEMGLQAPVWQRIRRVVEKASAGIEAKGLAIEDDLPQVEIWSDPLLMKVFFNLLDNTTRHGGGATRVRLSAFEKEGCLCIVYQDDGDGILPADKSRLFERGFGKNTGYGLFFAREILEMTGISICEEGAPGEGARFVISVPEGCWRLARTQ